MSPSSRKLSRGLSLIELMVALLISTLLVLGLMQVFGASRAAYQLSQGMARTQENARFAMDYLQRDLRMVGHFGCANDQARKQTPGSLLSHINSGTAQLDFVQAVQGYEATGTAPSNTAVSLTGMTTGWSPALPGYISGLNPAPNAGSDIIVVRFFDSDGVPVINAAAGQIDVAPARWSVLTQDGVANPGIFGISDCTNADVFQASGTNATTGVLTAQASGGLAASLPDFTRYTASPAGQTMLYRGEAIVYYIGTRNGADVPSLYRARFGSTPGGALTTASEELVEGVQNLQILYGQDQSSNLTALTGNIATYQTAAALGTTEANWRRVGQIKVGLIAISPEGAAAEQSLAGLPIAGVNFTPPADASYRSAYESSIALRNRLYGN